MFWKKKKPKFQFRCSQCGELHDTWPAITYGAPWHYSQLSEQEKLDITSLDEDFCEIHWKDQVDRFIRVTMQVPVIGFELDLEYGLWVSLSEKSYNDYSDNFENINHEVNYFGWVYNKLLGYDNTLSVPSDVFTQKGNSRPIIKPHLNFEHPLISDLINGISREEAESRIHELMKQ